MAAGEVAGGTVVIGTRGSPLARWQADHVQGLIQAIDPGLRMRQEIIVTTGDRFQSGPVEQVGGKSVWVKEIEEALFERRIDLAVHSLKDVPGVLPDGLVLGAFPPRADPRDALLSRGAQTLRELPAGAVVGTSSPRRACQVLALRPDLRVEILRGNVGTRIDKLDRGTINATLLACAGLDRLGFAARITERLAVATFVPAIGQGVLAIEIRAGDARLQALCARLSHRQTTLAVAAERALLAGLGGSCRTPIGGHAVLDGSRLTLVGLVGRPDGSELLREEATTGVSADDDAAARELGATLAQQLLGRGAARILAELG